MAGVRIFVVVVLLRLIQLASGSCQPGKFGDSCSYSCHCGTSCDETTGACTDDCDTGWMKAGRLCQKRNIALNKTASTTASTPRVFVNWTASNAVDGDSDIDGWSRTCFHADVSPSDWTVDLGQDFQLYDIRIYSRNGYYGRNANSNIFLNNDHSTICSTLPSPPDTPNPTDVTCNGTGRYVTIRNPGTGTTDVYADALNICEVEIYACSPGTYGVNCDDFCHCLNSTCDRWTGFCPGDCRPGWQGQRCDTACSSSTYGINCLGACAGRKCLAPNSSCDRHTGACGTGCLPGWTADDCTQECPDGKYGTKCTSLCSERHCVGSSTCDHVTGSCDSGCKDGWMGVDCKEECDSKHYGSNCIGVCSSRHCSGTSSCNSTGTCDNGCETGWTQGDCTECDSNHYGPDCKECSFRHCAENSSCTSTGTCDSGCETGWTQSDCTVPVICPSGRYGQGCTEFCSSRKCKTPSSVCDVTGACPDGCQEGWQNADCRITCQSGKYGSNCSKSCDSRHCETTPVSCDHVTGACASGCRQGWVGVDCTQRCKPGTFGPDCTRCGYCDVTCNLGDGRCPGTCLDGFTGDRCDEDVRVSPVTSGAIGAAVAVVVMLLLIGGLILSLLKSGRLKWTPSPNAGARNTETAGEIPAHENTSGMNGGDYAELDDITREREKKSNYDVVQNKVYENDQIRLEIN